MFMVKDYIFKICIDIYPVLYWKGECWMSRQMESLGLSVWPKKKNILTTDVQYGLLIVETTVNTAKKTTWTSTVFMCWFNY